MSDETRKHNCNQLRHEQCLRISHLEPDLNWFYTNRGHWCTGEDRKIAFSDEASAKLTIAGWGCSSNIELKQHCF